MTSPAPTSPVSALKRGLLKKSCLLKALLILAILAALAVGGLVWGTLQVMAFFKTFTAGAPLALPVTQPAPGQVEEIQSRITGFLSAAPGSPAQLRLTADDLNALIAAAPGWNLFRGRLHFTIEDNRLAAEATFPLRALPFVEGRYLNGRLELSPSVKKHRFSAGIKAFKAGERALPSYLLGPISQAVSGVIERRTGEMGAMLDEAARISIENNTLLIERGPPSGAGSQPR